MLEIIHTQPDGSFADPQGKINTLYIDGNHFEFFNWLKTHKTDKILTQSTHWRLFEIDSKRNKLNPNFLALDVDQIENKKSIQFNSSHISPIIKTFKFKKEHIAINYTGFGYHIYIFFNTTFNLNEEKWLKNYEKPINDELKKYGLKLDPASFQAHQTLRVPGSVYHKKGFNKSPTYIIMYPTVKMSWVEFKKEFDLFSDKKAVKKKEKNLNKEIKKKTLKEIYNHKDINWTAIMSGSGCRFLINQYHDQSNVNYQEWLAQISLTSKYNKSIDESYNWAKQFSEKSGQYNEQEFYKKFLEVRNNMSPHSCKQIESIWRHGKTPGIGCIDCPMKKLNQPLNITSYPNMDSGFRIENAKGVRTHINYESFSDWIIEQHLIQAERDETLYKYNGKFWEMIGENQFLSDYKKYIIPQIRPIELNLVPKFLKNHRVFNIEKEREKAKDLVFFRNTELNIKTDKFSDKFNSKVKNFYRLEFDYDDKAKAPIFEKVLDFSFKGKDKDREYFLMFIAAALFTEDNIHKSLILLGDGANGKSTLIYTAQCLFPKESSVFTKLDLEQIRKEPVMLAPLRRAKIAYCSDESPYVFNKNINLLKQLISKEDFVYRQKYARNSTAFRNQSKIIMGMNALPLISESTVGMKRRFSFLDFENQLKEIDFDPDIEQKLKKEKAGIFNIYYEALKKYKKIKNFPKISNHMLDTAVYLGDIKEAFWKDCIKITGIKGKLIDPDPSKERPLANRIESKKLWEAFTKYRTKENDNSMYSPSRRMFTEWVLKKKVRNNENLLDKLHHGKLYLYGMDVIDQEEIMDDAGNSTKDMADTVPF